MLDIQKQILKQERSVPSGTNTFILFLLPGRPASSLGLDAEKHFPSGVDEQQTHYIGS